MSTESRPVGALIGAGMVAKTHVMACLDAQDQLSLKGVYSRTASRAKALLDDCQAGCDVFQSLDDIAMDPEIDFVIVATPPDARMEIIAPLVAAGKSILLEKPIGRTAAEAREIVELCERAGVSLGIVFQHRARAASVVAQEMITSGGLGGLGLVEMRVPWWRDQAYYDAPGRGTYARDGGGVLISQAIHTIDLGLSLAGPVQTVSAMAKTTSFHEMEAEDFVVAGLSFANGAVGSLQASTASFPGGAETITLHFENGSLHLEAGQLRVSRRNGEIEVHGEESGTGGGADPMAFTHSWHQSVIENFAQVVQGHAEPIASGREALAAHDLIEAITRSAAESRPVEVGS